MISDIRCMARAFAFASALVGSAASLVFAGGVPGMVIMPDPQPVGLQGDSGDPDGSGGGLPAGGGVRIGDAFRIALAVNLRLWLPQSNVTFVARTPACPAGARGMRNSSRGEGRR